MGHESGFLQACPNCGGTKKPICEYVDCWCSDWEESEWYTRMNNDYVFDLAEWERHERAE